MTKRKENIKLMKVFRILRNNIRDAFKSVFRNISLSFASITCSAITLILVGIAILLSVNVNNFTKDLKEDLTIVVFMERGSSDAEAAILKEEILNTENVDKENLVFESNEDVKKQMQIKYEVFDSIMSSWQAEDNFLQHQFLVKVKDIDRIKETANKITKYGKVDATKYGEGMVDQLLSVFDVIEKGSIIIVGALIIVTAFLISNTIKLTIFSRKTEIEIMRLIGTSNTVIRLPFLFEGLFLGLIGAIIPVIVIVYGYTISYDKLGGILFSNIIKLVNPNEIVLFIALCLFAIGGIVGMFGSYKAVRKYLKI